MDVSPTQPRLPAEHFRIGEWVVYPKQNALACDGRRVTIEPRAMETLEFLASQAGTVVSPERLLVECWPGLSLGDNPVHKAIAQLRKALGDRPDTPRYIQTIRKRGYRLVAPVTLPSDYRGAVSAPASGWAGGSPFRGLDAFDAADASIFFGRSAGIAAALHALHAQARNGSAFVLLVGASGSGKTSLLRAGLMPRLLPPGLPGLDVVAVTHVVGRGPGAVSLGEALAEALAMRTDPPLAAADTQLAWRDGFSNAPERAVDRLAAQVRAARASSDPERPATLVLIIDQLEDFFSPDTATLDTATLDAAAPDAAAPDAGRRDGGRPSPAVLDAGMLDARGRERTHAVALLAALARSGRVAVVAACRSDAYARLSDVPGLLALKQPDGHVDLAPPDRADIAQIIRRPAQLAALTYEDGPDGRLDDVLRDAAAGHPQCLPLLQHVLQQLYEQREPGGRLTFAAYRALGGLDGALLQHAERALDSVPPAARAALPDLLRRLVRYADNGQQTGCVAVPLRLFGSAAERTLADALVRNRLLVGASDDGEPVVAIAHEALLRAWPRAAAWIEDNRDTLRSHARLAASAERWRREGRRRDLLLPEGRVLDEAVGLLRRYPQLLDDDARGLLRASRRSARQRQWLRRAAAGGLAALAFAALAGGISAQRARAQADRARAHAEAMVDYMLGDLTDRLERLGRLDLLDAVTGRILRDLPSADAMDADDRFNRSRALRQVGKIRIARGDSDGADGQIAESVALAEQLAREAPASAERLLNVGESTYWAGYLRFLRGDELGAATHWLRYRDAAERAATLTPGDPQVWIEASYALNSLGTLSQRREAHDQALSLFERSVAYKRKALALDADNLRLRADLADSLSWVADAQDRLGQPAAAQVQYARALQVLGDVRARAPDDAEWMHREAILRSRHGQVLRNLGAIAQARQTFAAAEHLLARICRDQPEHSDWARAYVASLAAAGELDLDDARPGDAQHRFAQAQTLLDDLQRRGVRVRGVERLRLRVLVGLARGETDPAAAARRLALAEAAAAEQGQAETLGLKDRLLRAELLLLRSRLLRSGDARQARRTLEQARALVADDVVKQHRDAELTRFWSRMVQPGPGDPVVAVEQTPVQSAQRSLADRQPPIP